MSLFADMLGGAVGGALESGGEIIESRIKKNDQEEAEIRKDDMAAKRAIAAEQLKEQFEQSKKDAQYKRLANEGEMIESESKNIDFKRNAGLINSVRSKVEQEGEFAGKDLTPEDIETIRNNMKPEDAEKYYGIKPRTALSVVDDQIAAAKNVGAYESRPALVEQRKGLMESDKADRKQQKDEADSKYKERLADAKDEANRVALERIASQADIANNRIAAAMAKIGAGSGGTKPEKVMSYIDGQRKEIASEAADLNKQMAADMKDAPPSEKAKIKAEYQPRIAALAKQRDQLNNDFKSIRKQFGLPEIEEKPAQAQEVQKPANTPITRAEFDKLPKGSTFIAPDGTRRIKP